VKIPLFRVLMSPDAPKAAAEVLMSGYVAQGPKVDEFEAALERVLGRTVVTVNSGTSALELALHLAGVRHGSEVLVSPMTCAATVCAIVSRGGRPVWVDVDPRTGLIDPEDITGKITPRTWAIVAIDWGGQLCDYRRLREVARGIPIVQDAAHRGPVHLTENQGDYGCYSTQAIKFVNTGDGGFVVPPPSELNRARRLRWFGLDRKSTKDFRFEQDIPAPGFKAHLNDLCASIGLANLALAIFAVDVHRRNAEFYHGAFAHLLSGEAPVTPPRPDPTGSWWLYTLLVDDRPGFIQYMAERGIETSPVHARNDRHSGFHYPNGPLPGLDAFASREVAIPVGWWCSEEDVKTVADAVLAWAVGPARGL
jgi:dTDP-4-amino-4,6-dideoxygalactose transaminase